MLKRIVATVVMCAISLVIIDSTREYKRTIIVEEQEKAQNTEVVDKKSFDIWYEYSGYEEYLKYVADEFKKETGIEVKLTCISDVGYANLINSKSIEGSGPDVYIASTSVLENLYLSGVVSTTVDTGIVNEENFLPKAISSITYDGKICGYPLGFDVSVLAYNADYITDAPTTFEDLKAYVGYEEEDGSETSFEGISNVFAMETESLFYNYGFFSEYMKVEKDIKTGKLSVSMNSEDIKKVAKEYVALKDYFGLSTETKAYSSIVADFAAGKTLFAVLGTDIIGNAAFDNLNYKIVAVPDYNNDMKISAMSYTESIVVNPYSDSLADADRFAKMASYELADKMYEKCKILSTKKNVEYENKIAAGFLMAYEGSKHLPVYMETEDYTLLVKNAINHIWAGSDVTTVLDELQNIYESKN